MTAKMGWTTMMACGLVCQGLVMAQDVVYEVTSPYHHIQVVDRAGMRTLKFDNATESRMSLENPLQGHFEYTEYFHMPWLWNDQIKSVLMIGLGGGSIQRAYQHYYPQVQCETVELDPKVLDVARQYFQLKESENLKVVVGDGRVHLRRTQKKYDLIILDAYTANRYGSFIPYELATQEFFALAKEHLTERGVLAYNVIGSTYGRDENIVGAMYRTLRTSFPQITLFPAASSRNVVLVATASGEALTADTLGRKADELIASKRVTLPDFKARLESLRHGPPDAAAHSRVMTDDFAPVDGLLKAE
jgi:spermidine synthase